MNNQPETNELPEKVFAIFIGLFFSFFFALWMVNFSGH